MTLAPLTQGQQAAFVGETGSELNDELTIIFGCVEEALRVLDLGHPARGRLVEIRSAAQRCAWKASALVTLGAVGNRQRAGTGREACPTIPDEAGLFDPRVIQAMVRNIRSVKSDQVEFDQPALDRILRDLFPGGRV